MKTVKSVNDLGQVIGGKNCSCVMDGSGYTRFLKSAKSIHECRATCCSLNLFSYIHIYGWEDKKYDCFEDQEDFDKFFRDVTDRILVPNNNKKN